MGKELCEPEDDDGFMPFIPFLEKMCAAEKQKASFVLSQVRTKTPHFELLYIWWSSGSTEKQASQGNIALNLRGKLYETEFLVLLLFLILKRKGGKEIYIF